MLKLFISSLAFVLILSSPAFSSELIVSNSLHVVSYQEMGSTAMFVLEDLRNTKNDMTGKYPQLDFSSISVDRNKNGMIDKGIDVSYSISGTKLCVVSLYDERSTSTCGKFPSKAKLKAQFKESKHSVIEHPIYTFYIPKKELSHDSSIEMASLIFKFYSPENRFSNYPSKNARTFSTTYSLKLSQK